ncbi:MAG TPA: hypothetical protein VF940_09575, partial [Streptosporangiaceae bacterium]
MDAAVPPDGPVRLGTVQLPAGSRISGGQDEPLLWATSALVADAGLVWLELNDLHGQTGLAPILLAYLDRGDAGEGRPWAAANCTIALTSPRWTVSIQPAFWLRAGLTPWIRTTTTR